MVMPCSNARDFFARVYTITETQCACVCLLA